MRARAEYELAGTGAPPAKAWANNAPDAAGQYARAFRLAPGSNVIARPVEAHEEAEAFAVVAQGLKRLRPGGGA